MANTSILAAFERMWQHISVALGDKADAAHDHDDTYVKPTQALTLTGVDETGETHTWTVYGVER